MTAGSFNALTLLVGKREGQLSHKKLLQLSHKEEPDLGKEKCSNKNEIYVCRQ